MQAVCRFLILSVMVSGAVKSAAQDIMPTRVTPVMPMAKVEIPEHLNPGLAIDLENPASFLYPEYLYFRIYCQNKIFS